MATSIYAVVLLLTLTLVQAENDDRVEVYVTYDIKTNSFQIQEGLPSEYALAAFFINAVNTSGWGYLEVQAYYNGVMQYNDSMKAYSAGLAEGYITRDTITQYWKNTRTGYCKEPYSPNCKRLRDFLQASLNWVRKSTRKNPNDPRWHQISDDIGDLETALQKPGVQNKPHLGHCSALVKNNDYSKMKLSLQTGHVSMETTIPNNNPSLYKHTKPKGCLFEPVRVWFANRLACNGEDWVKNFTRYNSGTYNNQWMVINQKLVYGEELRPGTLTVVEQLSGYVVSADETDVLERDTYWASYNIAYFPKIFNMSGKQQFVEKYGDYSTHDMCRRAQIFRRDHSKVKDKVSLFKLMSYNDFKHDSLFRCNCTPPYSADPAIASRADLNSETGSYPFESLGYHIGGTVDVKPVARLLNICHHIKLTKLCAKVVRHGRVHGLLITHILCGHVDTDWCNFYHGTEKNRNTPYEGHSVKIHWKWVP